MMSALFIGIVMLSLILASFIDILYFRIPNRIFYFLFYLFPLFVFLTGRYEAFSHYGLFLISSAFCFVLFVLGLMEGGDAKLISVVALWIGWSEVLFFLIGVALIGGVLGLMILAAPEMVKTNTFRARRSLERYPFFCRSIPFFIPDVEGIEPEIAMMHKKRMVPYGVAIALAGIGILGGFLVR